jgi:hypothetical protein
MPQIATRWQPQNSGLKLWENLPRYLHVCGLVFYACLQKIQDCVMDFFEDLKDLLVYFLIYFIVAGNN